MNIKEELRINGYQPIYGDAETEQGKFFQAIVTQNTADGFSIEDCIPILLSRAYTFGVTCGKREERARRKRIG